MFEDAIKIIVEIKSYFSNIDKISIIDFDNIILEFKNLKIKKKSFKNSYELIKWCEDNLKSSNES